MALSRVAGGLLARKSIKKGPASIAGEESFETTVHTGPLYRPAQNRQEKRHYAPAESPAVPMSPHRRFLFMAI